MFRLWQWHLTDKQIESINKGTDAGNRLFELYNNRRDPAKINQLVHHYNHAANIYTDDIEEAFRIGNIGKHTGQFQKLAARCHSISVGDILEAPDGKLHWCAPVGWVEIVC